MTRLVLASDVDSGVKGRHAVEGGAFRVLVREEDQASDPLPAVEAVASDAATPPALRTKVLARDGHACRNCSSKRGLHAHHVVWRSKGGPTTLENLVTICARCHSLVHEGFLDVEVAQCATRPGGVAFVFRDANGQRIERRVLAGARVTLRAPLAASVAQCAAPVTATPKLDVRWLATRLDWFDGRSGRFVVRPEFRDRLDEELREFVRPATPARTRGW
ncbi:MAG: HNH endonuclease [Planctomycetes bacterium]|nr:HNH endonuclease [Planctomycetota bacterium]